MTHTIRCRKTHWTGICVSFKIDWYFISRHFTCISLNLYCAPLKCLLQDRYPQKCLSCVISWSTRTGLSFDTTFNWDLNVHASVIQTGSLNGSVGHRYPRCNGRRSLSFIRDNLLNIFNSRYWDPLRSCTYELAAGLSVRYSASYTSRSAI